MDDERLKDISCSPMLTAHQLLSAGQLTYARPKPIKRVSAIPVKFFNLDKLSNTQLDHSKFIKMLFLDKSMDVAIKETYGCKSFLLLDTCHHKKKDSPTKHNINSRNNRFTVTDILKESKNKKLNCYEARHMRYKAYANFPKLDIRGLFSKSLDYSISKKDESMHSKSNDIIKNLLLRKRMALNKILKHRTIDVSEKPKVQHLPTIKSNLHRYQSIIPQYKCSTYMPVHTCKVPSIPTHHHAYIGKRALYNKLNRSKIRAEKVP